MSVNDLSHSDGVIVPQGYTPDSAMLRRFLPHAIILRKLNHQMAALYLDRYLPDVAGKDRIWAIQHYAGTQRRIKMKHRAQDSFFASAMFMAGVSLGDLAKLFGIRKQTVSQKVDKFTTDTDRKEMRDPAPGIDLEQLSLAKDMFDRLVDQGLDYEVDAPLAIGRGLIAAAKGITAEDRDEPPPLPTPTRYEQSNISPPQPVEPPPLVPIPITAQKHEIGETHREVVDPTAAARMIERDKLQAKAAFNLAIGDDDNASDGTP